MREGERTRGETPLSMVPAGYCNDPQPFIRCLGLQRGARTASRSGFQKVVLKMGVIADVGLEVPGRKEWVGMGRNVEMQCCIIQLGHKERRRSAVQRLSAFTTTLFLTVHIYMSNTGHEMEDQFGCLCLRCLYNWLPVLALRVLALRV